MPVPDGVITSTENFDQTKVVVEQVEEVEDDLPGLQDSSSVQPATQDE